MWPSGQRARWTRNPDKLPEVPRSGPAPSTGWICFLVTVDYQYNASSPHFLTWGDFHAHSRFARSTILEEKWGTTRSLRYFIFNMRADRQSVC